MTLARGQQVALGCLVLLLVLAPFIPGWLLFLLTIAFAKGLVVLGVVLLLRGDLVSFGHGLYYAAGAYTAGFVLRSGLPLRDALGRVVSTPAVAAMDVPPFDRAAMDGYAVRAEDTFGASRHDPRGSVFG